MQPYFMLLLIGKGSLVWQSYQTVCCMSSWEDIISPRNMGGHVIFCNKVKRPFLLTKPKVLVRSMNAMLLHTPFLLQLM